ncbi:neuroendocrine convertase [Anaeramoeba flamelloides]|uniref:Neuroendocrine convertase n=1 Tax=Anaeramoeba flamelloides TaxID=1746091 RepID=A0AAV7YIY6_9EUKA|nr:neuroendocrine convertase [Anaeramoeba flamelloides]
MKVTTVLIILFIVFSVGISKQQQEKSRVRSTHLKEPTPTGELIVKLKEGTTVKEFTDKTGLELIKKLNFGSRNYLFKKTKLEFVESEVQAKGKRKGKGKGFTKPISDLDSIFQTQMEELVEHYEENQYYKPYLKSYDPSDPLFEDQFHLVNRGQFGGLWGFDANVQPVWDEGIFGAGINLVIVDDGLYKDHKDLKVNYSPDLSYDYCNDINDPTGSEDDTHGTACAGIAGASGDDGACGVGIAPSVNLSGRRIICSGVTFTDIAEALSDEISSVVDISSNSWGDFGCDVYGCSYAKITNILKEAIVDGITNGRNGKGIIYTFAGGNEGDYGGNINHYSTNKLLEVIAVAAVSNSGRHSYYSNIGTGILLSTISSGKNLWYRNVKTRTTGSKTTTSCNERFSGTSSATPLLAGGIALMLETNPNLTSWDVQSILIESATFIDPPYKDNRWVTNNAGYKFSTNFGFGLFDANKAVKIAGNWENLPPIETFVTPTQNKSVEIPEDNKYGVNLHLTIEKEDSLTITGGVILYLSVDHTYIGDLDIKVISPHGTIAYVMDKNSNRGKKLDNHYFAIRTFYGENSKGTWTLNVRDYVPVDEGKILDWKLEFYGVNHEFHNARIYGKRTLIYPEIEEQDGSFASNPNCASFLIMFISVCLFFIF